MSSGAQERPNLVFIMSDDHAAHAISAYGSQINKTPNIDRIANEGMRFDNAFCTNALCAPSRASILTGTHSHVNEVLGLTCPFDAAQPTFPALMQDAGYQTAIVGKWHLGHGPEHDPHGFDYWEVLPGQGDYFDPTFLTPDGSHVREGYVTDIITDLSIDWLEQRDPNRPFSLLVHHKAPHRNWLPHPRHADLFTDEVPVPETFDDDYSNRAGAAAEAEMRVNRDLLEKDVKGTPPAGLTESEDARWKYQRYISDYLRCVAAVDESVGRILDYLDRTENADNTIVVYTSDQGFFLGDHGWYDKRFMYEESLRMPLLMRFPQQIQQQTTCEDFVTNVDFAQTFLDLAGVDAHERMQGRSFTPLLRGESPRDWQDAVYYRYWQNLGVHRVRAHYGIRTKTHKLIHYYSQKLDPHSGVDEYRVPEWELFDLRHDPHELHDRYHDPSYASTVADLTARLAALQSEIGDTPATPRQEVPVHA